MRTLNASAVSIIVLATSMQKPGKEGRARYSYFYDRAVPMKTTWARDFEVELAFGTNVFDDEFLTAECEGLGAARRLRVTHPQVPPRDAIESFACASIRVLYLANCTGEYMGAGPVCRCQESIRYWLRSARFARTKWFVFMDDDVYFRPYALLGLLAGFNESVPMAFVGAHGLRGLSLTRDRWKACGELCAFRFGWAQPAILSRGAIEKMRPMIDRNYMSEMQKVWYGTHDVVLGFALWWSSVPLLAFADVALHLGGAPKNKKKQKNVKPPPRRLQTQRVAHSERAHLAARLNTVDGLLQHAVRGETAGDLSAHKLFDALNDRDPTGQHQVGVNSRYKMRFFPNDGAARILPGRGPDSRLFLDPADCATPDAPRALLAPGADLTPGGNHQCNFRPLSYDNSSLRYADAGGAPTRAAQSISYSI